MTDRPPITSGPHQGSGKATDKKTIWQSVIGTLSTAVGFWSFLLPEVERWIHGIILLAIACAAIAVVSGLEFAEELRRHKIFLAGTLGFAFTSIALVLILIFQLSSAIEELNRVNGGGGAGPRDPRPTSEPGATPSEPDPPEEPGSSASPVPRKAAPNVTYVWNAFCAHRYLSRPADRVDPKEVAETDPDVDDPVLADDVWLDISVRRESEAELELTGIRIEEVGRNATPQTGVLVRPATGGCAEGTAQYAWRVELDEHPPAFSPVDLNTRPGEPVTRILLPYTIKAEHETFRLYFSSHGCACRFRVVLTWRHGGQETVPTALPEDGRRFFVVPRGSLPAYRVEQPSDGRYSMIQESSTPSPPSGPARDAAPDRAR